MPPPPGRALGSFVDEDDGPAPLTGGYGWFLAAARSDPAPSADEQPEESPQPEQYGQPPVAHPRVMRRTKPLPSLAESLIAPTPQT